MTNRRPKRSRGPEQGPLVRACATGLLGLLTGFSAGCVVLPAKATVAQFGAVQRAPGGLAVTVLFSRDFSPETPKSLGEEAVECVTRGLAETAPEVRIVSEEEFDRTIFGVNPGGVLLRRDTIGTLLTRPDISQRIGESGLTHLILVEGSTHKHSGDSGVSGIPYIYLHAWVQSKRSSQVSATIIELGGQGDVLVQAIAEGHQGYVVGFPLPAVGWAHATESASCDALGAGVARALRGKAPDEVR